MKRVCQFIFGFVGLYVVNSQFVDSPCPDVFKYETDGNTVYGLIHVRPSGPASSILTRLNFTVATNLLSSYLGRLEPIGNDLQLLNNYKRGIPIDYRVHFPVSNPVPKPTAIIVNDKILCYGPGDTTGSNTYVTSVSIQHMLYLKGGAESQFPNPESQFSNPGNQFINPFEGTMSKPVFDVFNDFDDGPNRVYTISSNNPNGFDSNTFFSSFLNQQGFDTSNTRPTMPPMMFPDFTGYRDRIPATRPTFETPTSWPTTTPTPPPPRPATSSNECGVSANIDKLPLIFNGMAYTRGDWPWLVAIYKRKDSGLNYICSGTLISDKHVVTAAHCMHHKRSYTSMKDIVVKIGVYNLDDWGDDIFMTRNLEAATIHEAYNSSTLANDILVLTFDRTVTFSTYVKPACLWTGNADLNLVVGATGVVAGWGSSELGPAGKGDPRMVRMPVVSTATCRASKPDFHKLTSSKTLCAGDRDGVGPCLGDSGGGLYLLDNGRWKLRGVVSLSLVSQSSDNSCNLNEYIVFTDAAQYSSWINNIISK